MSNIRTRLREAIERQSLAPSPQRPSPRNEGTVSALALIREAAEQIRDALKDTPEVKVSVEPDAVLISLNEKDLWFSYDPARRAFVGCESDTMWMEGGQREETYKWATAEACIEAMIQASARCVALARAAKTLRRR